MKTLVLIKQYIKIIYSKNEVFLLPLFKLLLALICLSVVNSGLGFMDSINNLTLVLVVALMCSFMPMNFIVLACAGFALLHMYALSLECFVVSGAIMLLMFLLYFRLSPKDTLIVLLLPICFAWKIPYVVPIVVGLLGTPFSVVAVGCGTVTYYMLNFLSSNATTIAGMGNDQIQVKIRFIVDGLLSDKSMFGFILAFGATVIVVYLIRKLPLDYSWSIAIITGALTNIVMLLLCSLSIDLSVSVAGVIAGTLLGIAIAVVVQFFAFHVDYSRTEKVQFEDDEYYYYVKAVPKITVAAPDRQVKKINSQKHHTTRKK